MAPNKNSNLHLFEGCIIALIWPFVAAIILFVCFQVELPLSGTIGSVIFAYFLTIGISQLLYVVPLAVWFYKRGRTASLKGLIIAALITLLLNGSCFILFITGN